MITGSSAVAGIPLWVLKCLHYLFKRTLDYKLIFKLDASFFILILLLQVIPAVPLHEACEFVYSLPPIPSYHGICKRKPWRGCTENFDTFFKRRISVYKQYQSRSLEQKSLLLFFVVITPETLRDCSIVHERFCYYHFVALQL